MKIVRYSDKNGGDGAYGILEGSSIYALEGDIFGTHTKGAEVGALDDVTVLAPLDPGKIVAIGLNYKAHVTELDASRTASGVPGDLHEAAVSRDRAGRTDRDRESGARDAL